MSLNAQQILMIGWEYPPHNSGGLGVACQGLTEALALAQTHIYFTLPYSLPQQLSHMDVLVCEHPDFLHAKNAQYAPFSAYTSITKKHHSPISFDQRNIKSMSENELARKVDAYAETIYDVARKKSVQTDIIHAHDWMTYPAAQLLKQKTGKPFVAHIHSTELDRVPGGRGNSYIAHTEHDGFTQADRIIAVSELTKNILIDQYGVNGEKIDVVHNGISPAPKIESVKFAQGRPVIAFMGRLTMQKGAEYFLSLAEKVLQKIPNALFIVAGHGDQYNMLVLETAEKKLSASVLFAGFLRDQQRDFLLNRADVFVMPSVSEPFGLVALEAVQHDTPVIISKTSGVHEVLPGAIAVDFWDVDLMTTEIEKLLKDPVYHKQKLDEQMQQVAQVTWESAAEKVKGVYGRILAGK